MEETQKDWGNEANETRPSAEASDAQALVVTYLLNNDPWSAPRAAVWERKVMALMQTLDSSSAAANIQDGQHELKFGTKKSVSGEAWTGGWENELSVSFSVERAIGDEISRGGDADFGTVIASYLVMLCYVTFSVGRSSERGRMGAAEGGRLSRGQDTIGDRSLAERAMLAATGLVMVMVSLLVATAVCSVMGVPATMILSEVIPFLVLAIGVDNVSRASSLLCISCHRHKTLARFQQKKAYHLKCRECRAH